MYRRILVPVDGSDTSNRGLDEALNLAADFGAKLRLVHVLDEASLAMSAGLAGDIGPVLKLMREGGERILAAAKDRARSRGVDAELALHDTFTTPVSDLIVKEAADWKAELIVIGTHGRRGVRRLLLGSDAEQVLRTAPVPVLLVRGDVAAR